MARRGVPAVACGCPTLVGLVATGWEAAERPRIELVLPSEARNLGVPSFRSIASAQDADAFARGAAIVCDDFP